MLTIKHIEQLNTQVKSILNKKNQAPHIHINSNDEVSTIADHINVIIDEVKIAHSKLNENEKKLQHLQDECTKREEEVLEIKTIEKRAEERAADKSSIARYDSRTTLPNRAFFNEILNKSINHAKRHHKILAVLLIEIDDFAKINELLGSTKSSLIYKQLADRFTNTLRKEDILAKLDGDEFIVLLSDIGKAKFASTVAEKLLKSCAQPIKLDAYEFTITASIGICIFPHDGVSLESLLKSADSALYKAKRTGHHSYQFYTQEMDVEAREYLQLESALRKAIHNNELALYYQPKLHLKKGTIIGLEALMRWEHPVIGIISPAKFIPLAEETGLILQISEWAMREVCRTNKFWQDEGYEHLVVSLNLSSKQFHHPELSKIISNALNITGLSPQYLEFEMTEKIIMENIELTTEILNKISNIGVKLSIDHFGTGYSSISHLKTFPLSCIKIDQTFIKGIPTSPNDEAITNALISLAHNFGLEVIAEGVETAEQVEYLAAQNCDIIQGYFLSHPLPAKKIVLQFSKLSDKVNI